MAVAQPLKPAPKPEAAPAPKPEAAPAPKPHPLIRAVHGRMVDLTTSAEYIQEEARPEQPSNWLDCQITAGKLVRE